LKKITALDLEVDKASEQLSDVTTKLEAANKQSADVNLIFKLTYAFSTQIFFLISNSLN
jgi:hypothetical protein